MNFQLVVIAGVVGTYLVGTAIESFAWRNTSGWSAEARQRVLERVQAFERRLRILDVFSFGLILACVLRLAGLFSSVPILYAPRGLAVAIGLLALERVLRGWLTWRAFSLGDSDPAKATALQAAAISTVAQVVLAAWVGWWVLNRFPAPPKPAAGGTVARQTTGGTVGPGAGADGGAAPGRSPWMSEAEALQYCGRDRAYLERLTMHVRGVFAEPLRSTVDGRTQYRRDYLEQLRAGGWPSIEEMRKASEEGDAEAAGAESAVRERSP